VEQERQPTRNASVWREITTPGYLERARARAQKRTSPWNLLLIPVALGGLVAIVYALVHVMWAIHTFIYPEHIGHAGEFWGRGIRPLPFASSFLFLMPLILAALPLSLMIANCIVWCIPPARRAFQREGREEEWWSFPVAMRQLWQISQLLVPIGLLLSLVGAATLRHLR